MFGYLGEVRPSIYFFGLAEAPPDLRVGVAVFWSVPYFEVA
jgi:hypothetical protein